MSNDFTANDYLQLIQEIEYHNYCILKLDETYLPHAKEIAVRYERIQYLEELLNAYRAKVAREGFKLIKGGKYGG